MKVLINASWIHKTRNSFSLNEINFKCISKFLDFYSITPVNNSFCFDTYLVRISTKPKHFCSHAIIINVFCCQKNFVFVRDLFFQNSYNLLQRANQAFTMHSVCTYLAFFNIMQYNYAWTTTFVYSPRIMSLQRNR